MIILCQFTRMVEAIKKSLEYFGYENIRPNQEKVVRNYLEGNDVLFCSPTGRLAPVLKTVFFLNLVLCLGASQIYILIASLILMTLFYDHYHPPSLIRALAVRL